MVDEKAVFATIRENLIAMQNKDLNGVMATIHPESPGFATTRSALEDLFKQSELRFTLSDLKIVSATPEEVKVSFVQKTEKISGPPEIQGSITDGVHTLRKDHGKWKLYGTAPGTATPLSS